MQRTILLVEDNEDDVFFMERAFQAAGLQAQLRVAPDGQQAIDLLSQGRDSGDRPSLILLDLKLPLVNGFGVLQWLRQQADMQSCITIVLTSSALQRDVDEAYSLGAHSYLVKPASNVQLTDLMRLVDSYWLKANRFPSATVFTR